LPTQRSSPFLQLTDPPSPHRPAPFFSVKAFELQFPSFATFSTFPCPFLCVVRKPLPDTRSLLLFSHPRTLSLVPQEHLPPTLDKEGWHLDFFFIAHAQVANLQKNSFFDSSRCSVFSSPSVLLVLEQHRRQARLLFLEMVADPLFITPYLLVRVEVKKTSFVPGRTLYKTSDRFLLKFSPYVSIVPHEKSRNWADTRHSL